MLIISKNQNGSYYGGPFFRQEVFSPDQLVCGNLKIVTDYATLSKSDTPYPRGTVVGRATDGSWKHCDPKATDGSQTPAGIVVDFVDASEDDMGAKIYVQGEFNINHLHVLADPSSGDSAWEDDALKWAFMSGPGNIYLKNAQSGAVI